MLVIQAHGIVTRPRTPPSLEMVLVMFNPSGDVFTAKPCVTILSIWTGGFSV
jgi:hypothetical protein